MKTLVTLLMALLPLVTLQAQNVYTIEGEITNFPDSVPYSFALLENDILKIMPDNYDTILNGKFKIIKQAKETQKMILQCISDQINYSQKCQIWVKPGAKIKITGTGTSIDKWKVESDIPEQKEFNNYQNKSRIEYEQLSYLQDIDNRLTLKIRAGNKDSQLKADSIEKEREILLSQISENNLQILHSEDIGSVGLDILKREAMSMHYKKQQNKEQIELVYSRLTEEQKQSDIGKEIKSILQMSQISTLKAGDPMPDAELFDPKDNTHRLASYKGKYILLDFWGYSCSSCIAALPELKTIASDYKDTVTIISLFIDHKSHWKDTFLNKGITWLNLSDNKGMSGIALQFGVRGIPHFVLIAPDGIIQTSWTGYGQGKIIERVKQLIKY